MLSCFMSRPSSHLRLLTLISSSTHFSPHEPSLPLPPITIPNSHFPLSTPRYFSANRNNNNNNSNGNDLPTPKIGLWKISNEETEESVFEEDAGTLEGISDGGDANPAAAEEELWLRSAADGGDSEDEIFKGVEKEVEGSKSGEWATVDEAWSLGGEEDKVDDVFGIGDGERVKDDVFGLNEEGLGLAGVGEGLRGAIGQSEEERKLKEEEKVLSDVLKGKLQFSISFSNM